jgi:hypothetical protein
VRPIREQQQRDKDECNACRHKADDREEEERLTPSIILPLFHIRAHFAFGTPFNRGWLRRQKIWLTGDEGALLILQLIVPGALADEEGELAGLGFVVGSVALIGGDNAGA